MIDLSIILLVWRDRAFLPACLASIAAARDDLCLEVIVVENGVALEPGEYALRGDAARWISVRRIHNDVNRGVAPARNQGLAAAQGRFLMLLDVDTRVAQGALKQLVTFMDLHPEVGLVGPRLEDAQGHLQLTCRKLPTLGSKILRRMPGTWARAALADEMLATYDHRTPRAVDYVIGACQVIRRATYEQVGALDENFFYGPEDVDYCIRVWRAGWGVMYVPQAVVVHEEQRLTHRRALSRLTLVHSWGLARYFMKWRYLVRRPQLASP